MFMYRDKSTYSSSDIILELNDYEAAVIKAIVRDALRDYLTSPDEKAIAERYVENFDQMLTHKN